MVDNGTYTAVLDRFENDEAVLVLERDGEDVADRVLDSERLPEAGREQDAVFEVEVVDGDVVDVAYDPEETARRREAAQRRFDRLSKRPPNDAKKE